MFGNLFQKRATTKADVFFAVIGLIAAAWKVYDSAKNYQYDQEALLTKENK